MASMADLEAWLTSMSTLAANHSLPCEREGGEEGVRESGRGRVGEGEWEGE